MAPINTQTFEVIYRQWWPKVFRLCMGYVNDTENARDLAQEVFVTVYEKLADFRNEASIGSWIYRIATNKCLRSVQLAQRMPTTEISPQIPTENTHDLQPQLQLLQSFIAALPELDRLIITLELEEVKQAEIAEILGLEAGQVRVRIHRIKQKLAQKFNDYAKQHGL